MQKRIDEIQNKYREWRHLLPQLEEDIRRWKHAVTLIRDMDNFYTHEYQACHQAIEDGAELDLSTEGEYSIMSEDALWKRAGRIPSIGLAIFALQRRCLRQIYTRRFMREEVV